MNRNVPRRVILVGQGPCARWNYLPELARHNVQIAGVVDAATPSNGSTTPSSSHVIGPGAAEPQWHVISTEEWAQATISHRTRNWFRQVLSDQRIDGILIVSEARSHAAYVELAIELGIPVLVEKPILVPSGEPADWRGYYERFNSLRRLAITRDVRVDVMAQRRYHEGYRQLFRQAESLLRLHSVPVTSIDISYSDGDWRMPWEFRRENHPFHHGYGILHHSGYHFVDLLARLVSLNDILDVGPDKVEVRVSSSRLADFVRQIPLWRYGHLLRAPEHQQDSIEIDGEIDLWAQFRFLRDNRLITSAQLSLLHNGFSRRDRHESAADVYKGNGRVKHERTVIHIGPLSSLHAHSYFAGPANNDVAQRNGMSGIPAPGQQPDGVTVSPPVQASGQFQVTAYRNSGVVGGQPFQSWLFGSNLRDVMQAARARCLEDFLQQRGSASALQSHCRTNLLMALLTEALHRERLDGLAARPSAANWSVPRC